MAPSSFSPFEARVRAILAEHPEMPATVIAERVGWSGSISWFRDNVPRLRPEHRQVDPADRVSWEAGDAAQCDLWFPPARIPLEDGTSSSLPVLVIVAAYSRFMTGQMLPSRHSEDLLLGSWALIGRLGRVPRQLIWDNEAGIGRRGRLAAGVGEFAGSLATRIVSCDLMTRSRKGSWNAATGSSRPRSCRAVLQLSGGLQHPVQRLVGGREQAACAHDQGPPG